MPLVVRSLSTQCSPGPCDNIFLGKRLSVLTLIYVNGLDLRHELSQVMSSGQCGCQGFDLSQGDDYTAIFETLYARDLLIDFDDDTKRQVIQALCTGTVNDGDHLQVWSFVSSVTCDRPPVLICKQR